MGLVHLHDESLHMHCRTSAHTMGSGNDLGLQAAVLQRLHEEDPSHEGQVQADGPRFIHQQNSTLIVMLHPYTHTI